MTTTFRASGLALRADRGPIYGPLDVSLDAPFGVLTGSRGSGKTCLLLTLAGRMRAGEGTFDVLGTPGSAGVKALQNQSAIAGFYGIDGLEDSVTVGNAVTERLRWNAPWYTRVPRADDRAVRRALAPAFGEIPVPSADTMIWDLDEDAKLLVRIGLALLDDPRILFVDNVDHVHDLRGQAAVLTRLGALAASGTPVVVTTAGYTPALYKDVATDIQVVPMRQEQLV
ncbi:AAA family ATPase [Mycetocola spongiae]|uniref:AAA family ATPase n=1 Tax=Mycetocola spongiae TaxID=2859226 RepID=UPI001CF30FF3|nr:AAA family ATPase [Mycetocola spongiae]UCR88373.1 AAA family ATPase [Mycetocola spongiae]